MILETNEEGMKLALDLIDEIRDRANAQMVENQKRASFYYNLRVKERFFREGDLVLRKAEASGVGSKGKMAPNWEGPYQVKKILRARVIQVTDPGWSRDSTSLACSEPEGLLHLHSSDRSILIMSRLRLAWKPLGFLFQFFISVIRKII